MNGFYRFPQSTILALVLALSAGSISAQGQKPVKARQLPTGKTAKSQTKPAASEATETEFFEKNIRPLLAENCFQCHSKSNNLAQGQLQLDSQATFRKGGSRGTPVNAGSPEKSLLLTVVGYQGKLKMPPTGKLSEEKIALLTAWVKRGAVWPTHEKAATAAGFDMEARKRHWAWQPVRAVVPPTVKNTVWPHNPIDRFILSRLESKGLTPAKATDRRTLLRRVTYDLIGLPPTAEEMNTFLADKSPNAYEKVVERLLNSPHYGERWARHWLDLVRFAETDGHEFDFDKPHAYQYRDYIIRALNADIPYSQFVREHIAGDLLPTPRRNSAEGFNESLIGTGFWWFGEGKHSPVELRADESERVDNQIDVFSKTFLGLSMGCARCHDHKFDAITTKDYYALAGYLKSSRFQEAAIEAPERQHRVAEALAQKRQQIYREWIAQTTRHLSNTPLRLTAMAGETAQKNPRDPFHPLALLTRTQSPQEFQQVRQQIRQTLKLLTEQSQQSSAEQIVFEDFSGQKYTRWFVTGEAFGTGPSHHTPLLKAGEKGLQLAAVRATGAADSGSVSERLQGAMRSQTFVLKRGFILYRMAGRDTQVNLIIDGFQRIRFPIYGGLTLVPDGNLEARWYLMDVHKWAGHKAYIELLDNGAGTLAVEKIVFSDSASPAEPPNPLVVALLDDPAVNSVPTLTQKYQELLGETARRWQAGELETAADASARMALLNTALHAFPAVPAPADIAAQVAQFRQMEGELTSSRRVLAILDGTPEDAPVYIRGNFATPGETVPRRFLEAVCGRNQPTPTAGSGRLELAERLVTPTNPLVARVMVNRLWKHHFGEGIVRTPDDFGFMGERPTHPELLDWLAGEFVRQGWSLKKMHRLMVTSAAYRMASRSEAKAEESDPTNRLLHRMPIRRLEAEVIRDAVLAVSGRLDRTLYGPSVMPYLNDFMIGRGRPGASGPLDGAGRRSLYLSVRRNFLTPMFLAFDYPVPFTTIGRRSVSNVPAQALALMNNPFVIEQAAVWARRVLAEPAKDNAERVSRMYVSAFGRVPTAEETQSALEFLAAQDRAYGGTNDVRAWSDFCHVLFNVKEFIFLP